MTKLSEEKQRQIPNAIKDYANSRLLIGEICEKYQIDRGTLKRAVIKAGIRLRTHLDRTSIKYGACHSFQKEDGRWVKVCRDCGTEQPIENFRPDKEYSDGRISVCKDCLNFRRRPRDNARYENDPEYRKQCILRSSKRYHDNPEKIETARKRAHYNLTKEDFMRILETQGRKCAACGAEDPGAKGRDWAIDHDHGCCPKNKSCGKCIRGLLCHPCNLALGMVKDDPKRLRKLAQYLEEYNQQKLVSC
jgi:Recombination endonuclease VII